ncbi:hypothetical protein N7492_008684 [Penicillium capsulatum]|uniref:Extracellular membrane protein CFEM domain-containing protein n=1 Tax=Penicillium capsulatum TaxID=69766 RepID=A0A9W9HR72_9EURO|nr:hypothetical protein N7492_008684 [Penicillium capsulatum]KAJ6106088.1 hypothetical protein N7512_009605 [Penicillium capsulatum]
MRSFVAALVALGATAATAQSTEKYLDCATAALKGIDASKFNDCTDKTSSECFCANKDALKELSDEAKETCDDAGIDLNKLDTSLCSSETRAAPARHASKPMEPSMPGMEHKRGFMPNLMGAESVAPRVVYVTETRTECSCKSTPAAFDPMHMSQIPVDVPTSSPMMSGMAAAATPSMSMSHGVLVGAASSSSVIFRGASATPTPSGTSPNRFNAYEGAAPKASAVHSGVAALGVAAVMGLMVAL